MRAPPRPRGRSSALALALVLLGALPPARAADASELVERKIELVRRLLADTAATGRIEASRVPEAAREYAAGEAHYQRARSAQSAGDRVAALAALDRAMAALARARALAPSDMDRDAAQRQRADQRLRAAEGLVAAHRRHAARLGAAGDAQGDAFAATLARARALAAGGHAAEALAALDGLERDLNAALAALVGAGTLDYTARFASPIEELDHEMRRYASLADLVPVALAALAPPREAVAAVDGHLARARARHDASLVEVTRGDAPAAVALMRAAIDDVQHALAATGLYESR